MVCIPAPACVAALAEATVLWPNRRKTSDGICGDSSHASGKSDHNPDASGFAHAWDLSHDPANGVDCAVLSELLKGKPDHRVKYIIWNRRIWNPSISANWRKYTGVNPHTSHMHVSIYSTSAIRNDTSKWFSFPPDPEEDFMPFTIRRPQGGHIVVGVDGGVFAYDGAPFFGSLPGLGVSAKIVGGDWTQDGGGYWLMGHDGAIFSFGNASYKGGFNALPPSVQGGRKPIGLVTKGNGYVIRAMDPSGDGSLFDEYAFGV